MVADAGVLLLPDLGLGVGPTGHGDINVSLDQGPSAGLSLLGNNLPSIGQASSWGRAVGIPLGILTSLATLNPLAGAGVRGALTYGPGAFNSAFGLARSYDPAALSLGPGAGSPAGGFNFGGPSVGGGPSGYGAIGNPLDPAGMQQLALQMAQPAIGTGRMPMPPAMPPVSLLR